LNPTSTVDVVHVGSSFPPTTPSSSHLCPNHGPQVHQVPLPSSEGCGSSLSMDEYARGRRNHGETQEVGGPVGESRKRAMMKVVARFICLFVLALTTQANNDAGTKMRPRPCRGPIDSTEGPNDNVEGPNDNTEGPSTMWRTRLQCEGRIDDAEGPSTNRRAQRPTRRAQ